MTPLRRRMIEEMRIRNYSKHSIAAYVSAVYRLANHYGRRPDQLSREEVRAFLVDLVEERQVNWSYYKQVLAALRYFYWHVVRRGEIVDDVRCPRPEKTLPVVLSPTEVAVFFHAILSLKHRTVLMMAYGAGLRIGEAVGLRLSDIDRQRRVIRIQQGKGKKDRYTVLSPALVEMLDATCGRPSPRTCCSRRGTKTVRSLPAPSSASAGKPKSARDSTSGSRPTRCGTVLPRTSWKRGPTCG